MPTPRVIPAIALIASGAFVTTTALTVTAAPAQAQILRDIGRRASGAVERKANQKVDEQIEKAAEKLVNNAFESMFAEDKGSSGGKSSGGSSGGSSRGFSLFPNAPTEERYDFDAVLTYEIESTPKKGKSEKMLMQTHFNNDGKYMGVKMLPAEKKKEDGELFAIFDVKNQSMVMLVTGEDNNKASMAYSWKDAGKYAETSSSGGSAASGGASKGSSTTPASTTTYTHIGTKTIAGYKAEGHRMENAEGTVEVWVSNDPALSYSRLMGATGSMRQVRGTMPTDYPAGMLLETNTFDKSSGDKGRMTMTKVEKNAKVKIDMSEYPRLGKAK